MWFTVSGFVVMGLVSWFSLASHLAWPIFGLTQGPSWWYTHLSAKLDSSVRVSGRLVGCMVSSFLFVPSQILPVRNTTFLIRPPLARQLRQVVIVMPGQGMAVLVNSSLTRGGQGNDFSHLLRIGET